MTNYENKWFLVDDKEHSLQKMGYNTIVLTSPYTDSINALTLKRFMTEPYYTDYRQLTTIDCDDDTWQDDEVVDKLRKMLTKLTELFYENHTDDNGEFISDMDNKMALKGDSFHLEGSIATYDGEGWGISNDTWKDCFGDDYYQEVVFWKGENDFVWLVNEGN